jgi:hypothetical protein
MVGMRTFFFGNWITRTYLIAVLVMAAGTFVAGQPACIVLIALTSPVSVIFAPIFLLGEGWMTVPMLWLSVLAGLLLNTLLINTIVGQVENRSSRRRSFDKVGRAQILER